MEKICVTKEQVNENMEDVIVRTLQDFEKPCTYVTVRMKNGFTLRESTTCVDPSNYDEEIGKKICLEKIEDKVWFLLGYALQEKMHNTPTDYKQRMVVERAELKERYQKLCAFLKTQTFANLDQTRKSLMIKQCDIMAEFLDVLTKRMVIEEIDIDEK